MILLPYTNHVIQNEDNAKQSKQQTKSDVEEGKTVFVRNVPFDATPESLKAAFGAYGPVAFGALVKDKASGMSKGTAFVKFKVASLVNI